MPFSRGRRPVGRVIHLAFIHGLSNMSLPTRLRLFAGALNGGIVQSFLGILARRSRARSGLWALARELRRPFGRGHWVIGLAPRQGFDRTDNHVPGRSQRAFSEAAALDLFHGASDFNRAAATDRAWRRRTRFHCSYHRSSAQEARLALYRGRLKPWPAVHVIDAARVFGSRSKKGKGAQSSTRSTMIGVPFREIASLISAKLQVPTVGHSCGEGWQAFRDDQQFRWPRLSGVQRVDQIRWVGDPRFPPCLPTWSSYFGSDLAAAA